MMQLQHNVVNLLYTVKGIIETYLVDVEEGRYDDARARLAQADKVIRKSYSQVDGAIRITRRLSSVLRASERGCEYGAKSSISESWQDVRRLLAKEFRLDIVEIIDRIPEEFPALACGMKDLKEILYNLTKNALQAIGIQGKLVIRAQIKLGMDGKSHAVVSISDTGPGLSGNRLAQLFKPFYSTKSVDQGNGLGLYLTKELVSKNRGSIEVTSFEGCGTTFALTFLLAEQPLAAGV